MITTKNLKLTRHLLLTIILLSSLGGCISLIDEPAPITVYSLRSSVTDNNPWPTATWSLTIIRPTTNAFLDSNRIAVRPKSNVMQVYKGVSWSDTLPDLLQSHLVEAFENSGKIKSVSRQSSGVPADVALLLDVRQFEAVYLEGQTKPNVIIQIQAKVLEYPSNRVIASKTFSADVPAASKEIADVVRAFEQGLNNNNQEIIAWTLANGRAKLK